MNKKVILITTVALLLALGIFFLLKGKQNASQDNSSPASVSKSIKDLIASGVSQKCTFTDNTGSSLQESVTYISNKKMRGDFTSTVSGKIVKSHMIVVDTTSYIWTDGDINGFKSTFTDSTQSNDSNTNQIPSGIDVNKQGDYKCSAWVVDESYFVPPADVKFTDFSEMFKNQTGGSSQCAVCDSLSGDDKNQCQSALNCK